MGLVDEGKRLVFLRLIGGCSSTQPEWMCLGCAQPEPVAVGILEAPPAISSYPLLLGSSMRYWRVSRRIGVYRYFM